MQGPVCPLNWRTVFILYLICVSFSSINKQLKYSQPVPLQQLLAASQTGDAIGFRQLLSTTSFDTLELEIAMNYSVHSQHVSREISQIDRCVFGLSSWLSTRSSTFSMFSLTRTERDLPLPGCRSIVPALRIFFNRVSILPHLNICYKPVWHIFGLKELLYK